MITENYEAYADGGTQKDFRISVVGEETVIENSNMLTESIKLDEALCSDENLRFGCCEASQFTVQVANVFDNFEGKKLAVTVTMDEETTKYGTFKVLSDKPTADRVWRTITAYDAMRDIINADVLEWYNALTFPMTIRAFRDSFFNHLGITQKAVTLINDSFEVKGGFSVTGTLSGKTIINSICEFNGVFGHINRDGNFEYVSLDSASNFICPPYQNNSVTYEDYVTEAITKVTMCGSTDDIGTSVGADGNEYIIQNNPLIYGTEGTQALITAITNLLNKISQVTFRPYSLGKTIGNPCVELGDSITISTRYQTINSYVIKRVLSGIQALRDSYSATGYKVYPKEVNSIQEQINRTQGKMNELSRTVDETVSTVTRVEQIAEAAQETADGLADDVQTANNNASTALSTANNANSTAVTAQSQVTQMADQIVLKVDNNGNVVKVALSSDASTGSNVLIKGDNIQLDGNVTITSGFVLNAGIIQSNNYVQGVSGLQINLTNGTVTNALRFTSSFLSESQQAVLQYAEGATFTLNELAIMDDELVEIGDISVGSGYGFQISPSLSSPYLFATEVAYLKSAQTNWLSVDGNGLFGDDVYIAGKLKLYGSLINTSLTANRILVSDSDKNIVSSGYELDINTNNTSDTWLLVIKDSKIQHRLISSLADVLRALKLKDYTNNNDSYLDYGSAAMSDSDVTYIGAWHNDSGKFRLRAIKKADITVGKATYISPLATGRASNPNDGNSIVIFKRVTNSEAPNNGVVLEFGNSTSWRGQLYIGDNATQGIAWNGWSNGTRGSWLIFLHSGNCNNYCIIPLSQSGSIYAGRSLGVYASSETMIAGTDKGNRIWACSSGSDQRIKTNIKPSTINALNIINQIPMRSFDYTDKKYGTHSEIGYIAQEVMNIMPDIVFQVPLDNEEEKAKYGTDWLYQIEDKPIIPYLVKAIQELSDKIMSLENKLKTEE